MRATAIYNATRPYSDGGKFANARPPKKYSSLAMIMYAQHF